jgi:hypothetical protein
MTDRNLSAADGDPSAEASDPTRSRDDEVFVTGPQTVPTPSGIVRLPETVGACEPLIRSDRTSANARRVLPDPGLARAVVAPSNRIARARRPQREGDAGRAALETVGLTTRIPAAPTVFWTDTHPM